MIHLDLCSLAQSAIWTALQDIAVYGFYLWGVAYVIAIALFLLDNWSSPAKGKTPMVRCLGRDE